MVASPTQRRCVEDGATPRKPAVPSSSSSSEALLAVKQASYDTTTGSKTVTSMPDPHFWKMVGMVASVFTVHNGTPPPHATHQDTKTRPLSEKN